MDTVPTPGDTPPLPELGCQRAATGVWSEAQRALLFATVGSLIPVPLVTAALFWGTALASHALTGKAALGAAGMFGSILGLPFLLVGLLFGVRHFRTRGGQLAVVVSCMGLGFALSRLLL